MQFSSKLAWLSGTLWLVTAVAPALAQPTALFPGAERIVAMLPDCTAADQTMMSMGKSMASMPSTANIDKDFMAMAVANAKMMAKAANLEMECSKKPEMRQMAEAVAKRNRDILQSLGISSGSTH